MKRPLKFIYPFYSPGGIPSDTVYWRCIAYTDEIRADLTREYLVSAEEFAGYLRDAVHEACTEAYSRGIEVGRRSPRAKRPRRRDVSNARHTTPLAEQSLS